MLEAKCWEAEPGAAWQAPQPELYHPRPMLQGMTASATLVCPGCSPRHRPPVLPAGILSPEGPSAVPCNPMALA